MTFISYVLGGILLLIAIIGIYLAIFRFSKNKKADPDHDHEDKKVPKKEEHKPHTAPGHRSGGSFISSLILTIVNIAGIGLLITLVLWITIGGIAYIAAFATWLFLGSSDPMKLNPIPRMSPRSAVVTGPPSCTQNSTVISVPGSFEASKKVDVRPGCRAVLYPTRPEGSYKIHCTTLAWEAADWVNDPNPAKNPCYNYRQLWFSSDEPMEIGMSFTQAL